MNSPNAMPNTTTPALRWQWLVAISCYLIGVPAGLLGLGVVGLNRSCGTALFLERALRSGAAKSGVLCEEPIAVWL
jgi:hypothetical protein